jgi:hypothetical protein
MAGDDIEPFEIKGNLAIVAASDVNEFGDGSVDIDGNINLNGSIGENTIGNGIFIRNIKHLTIKDQAIPDNPISNEFRFFIDSSDDLFKSINSSGLTTTYQPLNSKGDILTHDGNTQIRLPLSANNGYVLSADPNEISGLKWVEQTGGSTYNDESVIYISDTKWTEIVDVLKGAFFNCVYNKIDKGPSANFFYAKSDQATNSNALIMNSVPCLNNNTILTSRWNKNEEPELSKDSNNCDGNYSNKFYSLRKPDLITTLIGETWTDLYDNTFGNFILTINNDHTGPCSVFFVSKNVSSYNAASIIRIVSSPGPGSTNLRIRWLSNSPLQLKKNKTFNDGDYSIINLLDGSVLTYIINISGTNNSSEIGFSKFQRYSGAISVTPDVQGGPSAIFTLSKNSKTIIGNISRVVSSPGLSTGEQLDLSWNAFSQITISKDGSNYSGNYIIKVLV